MNITRKHHYVWRYYLSAWSFEDNKVLALKKSENKILPPTDPKNLLRKKDFYEVKRVTEADISFVNTLFRNASECVRENIKKVLKDYYIISKHIYESEEKGELNSENNKEMYPLKYEYEEKIHTKIEENTKNYIEDIKKRDLKFLYNKESYFDLLYYLAVQYIRTKKIRDNYLDTLTFFKDDLQYNIDPNLNPEGLTTLMKICQPFNLAYNLAIEKYKVLLIINNYNCPLITTDQPVVNTYEINNDNQIEDCELYYPVSPRTGILLTKDKKEFNNGDPIFIDTLREYQYYNDLIASKSHDWLISSEHQVLEYYRKKI